MNGKSSTLNEFVLKANDKHSGKYLYLNVIYHNSKTKINITCHEHGIFSQRPGSHISGAGCPQCKAEVLCNFKRMSSDAFIKKANEIHSNVYEYSKINYINNFTDIEIICKDHGPFWQNPSNHLYLDHGCPKCANTISRMEIQWLNFLNVSEEHRQKILYINGIKIKSDAYDPTTNTIYEFWGDYWHGNPERFDPWDVNHHNKKTFGELFQETQEKRNLTLSVGYNLVEMWEFNFKKDIIDRKSVV